MSLSQADVEKVALLSRLKLTASELETMTTQLGRIVEYVEQLSEINTDNVAPMDHAMDITNVFRDDQPTAGLDREEALANAPKRDDECYRVPAVLGE